MILEASLLIFSFRRLFILQIPFRDCQRTFPLTRMLLFVLSALMPAPYPAHCTTAQLPLEVVEPSCPSKPAPIVEGDSFGWDCVRAIRQHLAAHPGLKWRDLRGADVAALIDAHNAAREPGMRAKRQRKLDLVFEALAEIAGADISQLTSFSRGPINKVAQALREASPGMDDAALADEVRTRASLYKRRNPTWPLTPTALAKHWPELVTQRSPSTPADTQPEGWEDIFMRMHGGTWTRDPERRGVVNGEVCFSWLKLPRDIRNRILTEIDRRG